MRQMLGLLVYVMKKALRRFEESPKKIAGVPKLFRVMILCVFMIELLP